MLYFSDHLLRTFFEARLSIRVTVTSQKSCWGGLGCRRLHIWAARRDRGRTPGRPLVARKINPAGAAHAPRENSAPPEHIKTIAQQALAGPGAKLLSRMGQESVRNHIFDRTLIKKIL